jgi:YidC/Oxa1 family membrane protein insertase
MLSKVFNFILINPISALLVLFYVLTGSSFIATIALMTLLFKIIVFPLTKNQLESSQKLKDAKPRIEKINEKYEDDPMEKQKALSKLYKEIGYNPAGCFTSFILQIPLILGLYNVIRSVANKEELYIYPFVRNLLNLSEDFSISLTELGIDFGTAASDMYAKHSFGSEALPYIGIVVLVVVAQAFNSFLIFKRTQGSQNGPLEKETKKKSKKDKDEELDELDMTSMMEQNQNIFLIINTGVMAVMLGTLAWRVPLGLSVYWIFSTIYSIIQSQIIYKAILKD